MYLVYYYATISGHSRIKAAMLQLSNCTLSHPFYSCEAGCLNKSCFPKSSFISSSILYHGPFVRKGHRRSRCQSIEGGSGRRNAPNREESPDSRSISGATQLQIVEAGDCSRSSGGRSRGQPSRRERESTRSRRH